MNNNYVMGNAQDSSIAVKNSCHAANDCHLMAEDFLQFNYAFRRNVLRGIVEYRHIDEDDAAFRPLTKEAVNSILIASKKHTLDEEDLCADIKLILESDMLPLYDPVREWLDALPRWDGKDRVVSFWGRIPGLSAEQLYFLSIWHRSTIVHWLGMDHEHGNETVPLLIGQQGCGKSTFCIRLLPPHLRCYYLDHFNLTNKFDKEMALCGSLMVCLDEIDQYKPSQMAELKQALSKVNVNGRKIYGKTIEQRQRYASFLATTNNRHPLNDPTGSRRYLCLEIPKDSIIDNDSSIDYEQLYAQLLYEVREKNERHWFSNEETKRLQQLNIPYNKVLDLQQMVELLYSMPDEEEQKEKAIPLKDIRETIQKEFPNVTASSISSERIGRVLRNMSFKAHKGKKGMAYFMKRNII